jgi:ABC-2 type transport system permease protein
MKLLSLLKKDLLLLLRDRVEMAVLFLMPLAFIIPISLALGAGDGYGISSRSQMLTLTVADYDRGPRAQVLLTAIGESVRVEKMLDAPLLANLGLANDPDCQPETTEAPAESPVCVEIAGRAMLERSWRTALLIIPEGFSLAVDEGQPVETLLLYDPAGDAVQVQQIEGVVKGATIKLSLQNQINSGFGQLSEMLVLTSENVRESVEAQAAQAPPAEQQPALRLEKVAPANFRQPAVPDTYQQTIPGYTVMYVFFIITSLAGSIRSERLFGTFRRLLSAPVSRANLLGGKLLATMLVGLLQVFLLFGAGALLFGLRLGNDPLAFFLLTLALVAAATAVGLAAATTRLSGGVLAAPLIIAALLGGSMFPLDLMPPFLRSLSRIVPHSWALTGYQNLMVRGLGLQEVFPQIAVLVAFALLFFLIAVLRFDFESLEAN